MARAKGVLPDQVIRDHRSEALLIFLTLASDLDQQGVRTWLATLTELVHRLTRPVRAKRAASVAVGFGPSFFTSGGQPRFGIDPGAIPAGFATPPTLQNIADPAAAQVDVLLYVMTLSEAVAARFLEGLSATRPALARMSVERGYQRQDDREPGGFRDGLRNPRREERARFVFIDGDELPEEPAWCEDGTYLAYLKVRQDLDSWARLDQEEQQRIIGRRKSDGSRLDLPEGTDARDEGPFTSDEVPPASHVRKSGPRSDAHDRTRVFRRGVPWISARDTDAGLEGGLQFVSFQSSLDSFAVVLSRWMFNDHFPQPTTGTDLLFARGFASLLKGGVYFVAPHDGDRFLGAGVFDPPPRPRPTRTGRLAVRKRVTDQNGISQLAELAGAGFQARNASDNQPIGEVFFTDSAGHALSPELPTRTPLIIAEAQVPAGQQALTPEQTITIEHRRQPPMRFENRVVSPSPGYGG